ncbi:MAG: DUF6067 family protein [Candidatus Hydrogenedentes bacterium]|nr:DUF6067 family protein [Candidatus Hydrogenedentota bacterium]
MSALKIPSGPAEPKFTTGRWLQRMGDFCAIIVLQEDTKEAAKAHIPWRRRDRDPEKKDIVVRNTTTGERINNVVWIAINREFGDLVFEPQIGRGGYAVFYMPYTLSGPNHQIVTTYPSSNQAPKPDPEWLARNNLRPEDLAADKWKDLPEARTLFIEARTKFDSMSPMELIATSSEMDELASTYPGAPYYVFPESRIYPIRMTDDLPYQWIQRAQKLKGAPLNTFSDKADRGEFFTFQLGVYAARQELEDVHVEFGGIEGIATPEAFRCINTGGVDWLGRPFTKNISVAKGKVQALWCGVPIPKDIEPGVYMGTVTVRPKNAPPIEVKLEIVAAVDTVNDSGDADLWRMARLRWLDSTIGLDDDIVAPYTPLAVNDHTVGCLGREVRFGGLGWPESIRSKGVEILDKPVAFIAETADGIAPWDAGKTSVTKQTPGAVEWESEGKAGTLGVHTQARIDFDGYLNFRVTVKADATTDVKDLRLELPIRKAVATYLMGMGRKGGVRPAEWDWTWDAKRANNSLWIGDADAGLQCKLKDNNEAWNLYGFANGLPASWSNDGKGGCRVREAGPDQVLIQAFSGPRRLAAGEELTFSFGLLVTPVKPLDPGHWNWRYQHQYVSVNDFGTMPGNIINIHQGPEPNPYINYPFLKTSLLRAYTQAAHDAGRKVKIYYTVRELSNHCAELFALRSLGNEIFVDGPGGGYAWLVEHLVDHYTPAWHELNLPNNEMDGAIATTGLSRWHNYYLEGLAWLGKNVGIDGLYLDGIGYDRTIMQRVRKVMERTRPGSLIDFHSGNNFAPEYGLSSPANQYMEHFPYIDSLWFGEGYDYNETPDYWLVEISGIPFGLYGEMLQGGGNPWRGMVYGMTNRYGWQGDPRAIWKLWDAFGIQDARMIGYWDKACPVKTGRTDVLATAYVKQGRTLVALASWAQEPANVTLAIDWAALGLDPSQAKIQAPVVEGFQQERALAVTDPIPVEPGKGAWLFIGP